MTNIWSFLLQTLTVSTTAALLLVVKGILTDKFSPRWQYGVWSILALRILVPAGTTRNMVPRLGIWIEAAKAAAEASLSSAYTEIYGSISPRHTLPWLTAKPESLTDWLFVVYLGGVILSAGWYLASYWRLRLRLRKGRPVSPAMAEKIANVRPAHWRKPWRCVQVEGISSAFVCGVIRPVLVVPAGQDIDEKVLLHEMLHLQYRDSLQSILWTALRCLHWCNPFLHYVFDRIGNDMESLCDQRVLERLEGEERRQYGQLLLTMANQRYARVPGTTSISNGGRNIARRIEAIVRFKRYPRGMALVSVCIGISLLSPVLVGNAVTVDNDVYQPGTFQKLDLAMAAARVRRCTTAAGAIDTYAKGILCRNGIYIATASPLDTHGALQQEMTENYLYHGSDLWGLDPGYGLEYLYSPDGYDIYDLIKHDDGSYTCYIAFCVSDFADPDRQDWPTDLNGVEIVEGSVILPLRVFREEDAWVVEEREERILANIRFDQLEFYGDDLPWLLEKTVSCQTGTITITHRITCGISSEVSTNNLFGWTAFDDSLNPDAEFSGGWVKYHYIYQLSPDAPLQPERTATLEVAELDSPEDTPEFHEFQINDELRDDEYESFTGSTTGGASIHHTVIGENWNGILESGGGHSFYGDPDTETLLSLPAGYAFRVSFDGEIVDEIITGGFAYAGP